MTQPQQQQVTRAFSH